MLDLKLHKTTKILIKNSNILLILGDGRCLKDDLGEFLGWKLNHDVGAIGRSIKVYPGPVQHWFNADGEGSEHWAKNLQNGKDTVKHTLGDIAGFDADWEVIQDDYNNSKITNEKGLRLHGSSALFAVLAGLYMGFKRIILAGCPLDTNGHWYFGDELYESIPQDVYGPIWLGYDFMAWLDFREHKEAERVKSVSGYTAKILGKATKEWAVMSADTSS